MIVRALYATAVLNVGAALHALTFPEASQAMLYGLGPPADASARANHYMLWLIIGLFGFAYFKAARDVRWRDPVLFLGGGGKLIAAAAWLATFFAGTRSYFLVQGAVIDGLLGAYFLFTLRRAHS